MAQNTNRPNGCTTGIVRGIGAILLISGFGNAVSGEVGPGIGSIIVGGAMLLTGVGGKKQKRRRPAMSVPDRGQMSQEAREHAQKAAAAAERARQLRSQKQSTQPRQTAAVCPNPEPHRHFELQQTPPASQVEQMVRNRKTLYEAGLLTRAEYDAEVRKLRGR